MILLVIVLVPQFYSVFFFKNKRHGNKKRNSPLRSNPLHEKLKQLEVELPKNIETTKTSTATTIEPIAVDPIKLSQKPFESVPSPNFEVPQRDRGHLDTSDLDSFDNAPRKS